VSAGDGSESDPYIITGWDIDAGASDGIVIRNTTAHFLIQNVNVYSNNLSGSAKGINIYNVENGTLANSVVRGGLEYGVHLEHVRNTTVRDMNVSDINWFAAIVSENSELLQLRNNNVTNCTGMTVSDLRISNAYSGIQAAYLDDVTIENCTILFSIFNGMNLRECDGLVIHGNNVSDSGSHGLVGATLGNTEISNNTFYNNSNDGVRLDYTDWTNVTGNLIWNNYDHGLELYRCNGGNVTMNNIVGNGIAGSRAGLYVGVNTVNFAIYNNNIVNNTIQAYDVMSNTWNATYPTGGNYWDNYTGIDNYSGVNQDIPGGDGIGDSPFIIDPDSQDNYPLMEPIPEFGELVVPVVSILGLLLILGFRSKRRPNGPE